MSHLIHLRDACLIYYIIKENSRKTRKITGVILLKKLTHVSFMSNSHSSACATCSVFKPVFIFWVYHVLWWLKLSGGVSASDTCFAFFHCSNTCFSFFLQNCFISPFLSLQYTREPWRILKYKKKSEVEIFLLFFAFLLHVF